MRYACAIALLCISTPLSAGERCTKSNANRVEISRTLSAKPNANRVDIARMQRIARLLAWQRAVLFEQQIL